MTTTSGRYELVQAADRRIRLTGWDRTDPLAALAAWPELVEAADQVLTTQHTRTELSPANQTVAMVKAVSDSMHREQRATRWPPVQPDHAGLREAIELLHRTVLAPMATPQEQEAIGDRMVRCLYIAANTARSGLDEHLNDRIAHHRGKGLDRAMDRWHRLERCEQMLEALAAPWPTAWPPPERSEPTDRLSQALTTWQVQAHRAVATDPTLLTLRRVAQGQGQAQRICEVVLGAAGLGRTSLPPEDGWQDVCAAVGQSTNAWMQLFTAAERLTPLRSVEVGALVVAAREVTAAARDTLRPVDQGAAPASALASKVDLTRLSRTAHQLLISSADLAAIVLGVAEGPLNAPARRVHTLEREHAQRLDERHEIPGVGTPTVAKLPRFLPVDQDVPVPRPLTAEVRSAARGTALTAERAAGLSVSAHPPTPEYPGTPHRSLPGLHPEPGLSRPVANTHLR